MNINFDFWRNLIVAVGGFLASLFGGFDVVFQALLVLIFVDFCTGYTKAIVLGKLSSKKAFTGALRKFLIFAVIICFAQIDRAIQSGATAVFDAPTTNIPPVFRSSALVYYILTEALSILENVAAMGLPVPTGLVKRLDLFRNNLDEKPVALSEAKQ